MKRIVYISLWIVLYWSNTLCAQEIKPYWVLFTNKANTTFNPYTYFDAKAIARREKIGVSLYDSTDFPLNENYVSQIQQNVDTLLQQSRWFNAVAVKANPTQISHIKTFAFVSEIIPMQTQVTLAEDDYDTSNIHLDNDLMLEQTKVFQVDSFRAHQLNGKGVRIAVFDGGFPGVNTSPAFAHIRAENRIIKTWDFASNNENVYHSIQHGTMVLSCIAGRINGIDIGCAPEVEVLLARTETRFEPYSEEENWLAAIEWADKNGVDIVNSSLGYTVQRYFNNQMDGKTSLVSQAATLAARKGILVLSAAGNNGRTTDKWHYIATPADADSILTVGGVDVDSRIHTEFSSYGPTTDKRMKPNVCAYGHVIAASETELKKTQGTSFASPLVAGFAACVLQQQPNLTNMQLLDKLQRSSHLYPYFDYAHGYGIPQASYFFKPDTLDHSRDSIVNIVEQLTDMVIQVADQGDDDESDYYSDYSYDEVVTDTTAIPADSVAAMDVMIDSIVPNVVVSESEMVMDVMLADSSILTLWPNNYLYYNIQNEAGVVKRYYVVEVYQKTVAHIPKNELVIGDAINVYYKGVIKKVVIR